MSISKAKLEYCEDYFEIRNSFHSVEDERGGNPYNCSFGMRVRSGEFSGETYGCECDYQSIKALITNLEDLINFKINEVSFHEFDRDSHVIFSGDGSGHITVSGMLYGDYNSQSLKFKFMTDQTVYTSFISELKQL